MLIGGKRSVWRWLLCRGRIEYELSVVGRHFLALSHDGLNLSQHTGNSAPCQVHLCCCHAMAVQQGMSDAVSICGH